MAGPWGVACMNAFIAASSAQMVPVQKVLWRSRSSPTARLPSDRAACHAMRSVRRKNDGRYRHDLTRRRVMETSVRPHDLWLARH